MLRPLLLCVLAGVCLAGTAGSASADVARVQYTAACDSPTPCDGFDVEVFDEQGRLTRMNPSCAGAGCERSIPDGAVSYQPAGAGTQGGTFTDQNPGAGRRLGVGVAGTPLHATHVEVVLRDTDGTEQRFQTDLAADSSGYVDQCFPLGSTPAGGPVPEIYRRDGACALYVTPAQPPPPPDPGGQDLPAFPGGRLSVRTSRVMIPGRIPYDVRVGLDIPLGPFRDDPGRIAVTLDVGSGLRIVGSFDPRYRCTRSSAGRVTCNILDEGGGRLDLEFRVEPRDGAKGGQRVAVSAAAPPGSRIPGATQDVRILSRPRVGRVVDVDGSIFSATRYRAPGSGVWHRVRWAAQVPVGSTLRGNAGVYVDTGHGRQAYVELQHATARIDQSRDGAVVVHAVRCRSLFTVSRSQPGMPAVPYTVEGRTASAVLRKGDVVSVKDSCAGVTSMMNYRGRAVSVRDRRTGRVTAIRRRDGWVAFH